MQPQIVFDITPKGQVKLQTQGFAGEECKNASRAYELALGLKQSDLPTGEMFQSSATNNLQPEIGG